MGRETDLLSRGVEAIYPSKEALSKHLLSGKKLKIYLGIDPTAPEIHLGHTILLRKLRAFQDLGHKIILLVGDFTALIGDPTDKTAMRQPLTMDQVKVNSKTYQEQARKILDFTGQNPAELRYNSSWLQNLTFTDFVNLASKFTIQQFLERDMFEKRLREKKPIGLHEFLYPLMQGYDSVELGIDMEVGGTDQTFNMLIGREMVSKLRSKEKFVLSTPLIEGTDGQKMSKSLNNTIALTDKPQDMFGKIMSIKDELILKYLTLLTDIPEKEIALLSKAMVSRKLNPIDAKKQLAVKIVSMYYTLQEAKKAEEEFRRVFQEGGIPKPEAFAFKNKPATIVELLVSSGLAASKSEAKRLVNQGGVLVNGGKVVDEQTIITPKSGTTIQAGKFKSVQAS